MAILESGIKGVSFIGILVDKWGSLAIVLRGQPRELPRKKRGSEWPMWYWRSEPHTRPC